VLEVEHNNLRVALAHLTSLQDGEAAANLTVVLAPFWQLHGHLSEGRRWLVEALWASRDSSVLTSRLLTSLGIMAYTQGDYEGARTLWEQSLSLSQRQLQHKNNSGVWVDWDEQSSPGAISSASSESTFTITTGQRPHRALQLRTPEQQEFASTPLSVDARYVGEIDSAGCCTNTMRRQHDGTEFVHPSRLPSANASRRSCRSSRACPRSRLTSKRRAASAEEMSTAGESAISRAS
jgi:hypothetical protein